MSMEKTSRRGLLKTSLASVAGVAVGYSLYGREASAEVARAAGSVAPPPPAPTPLPAAKPLSVTIPKLSFSGEGKARALSNKHEVLSAVAPVMTALLEQAGDKLSSAQLEHVKAGLLSKGSLVLPKPGQGVASITISTLEFQPESTR